MQLFDLPDPTWIWFVSHEGSCGVQVLFSGCESLDGSFKVMKGPVMKLSVLGIPYLANTLHIAKSAMYDVTLTL